MRASRSLRLVGFVPFFTGCQQHPYDGHQEQRASQLDPRHDGLGASHQPIEKFLHALCALLPFTSGAQSVHPTTCYFLDLRKTEVQLRRITLLGGLVHRPFRVRLTR
jgi:hypothetical protein